MNTNICKEIQKIKVKGITHFSNISSVFICKRHDSYLIATSDILIILNSAAVVQVLYDLVTVFLMKLCKLFVSAFYQKIKNNIKQNYFCSNHLGGNRAFVKCLHGQVLSAAYFHKDLTYCALFRRNGIDSAGHYYRKPTENCPAYHIYKSRTVGKETFGINNKAS